MSNSKKLISDIINELVDVDKSISGSLLKTKVLASRIRNVQLAEWANYELIGYPDDDNVPSYRKDIEGLVIGDYLLNSLHYNRQPLITNGLSQNFTFYNFKESITTLEQLLNDNSQALFHILPAEMIREIELNWKSYGYEFQNLKVINAIKVIYCTSVKDIINQVRNRLLNFMLEIDLQYGSLTELNQLSNQTISQIMNQTIINANGDGNVVTNGNNNDVIVDINIEKSNKEQLKDALRMNKVSDNDIFDLVEIIDNDNHNPETKVYGDKTKTWLERMMIKSVNGGWNIAIGAAGNILATILQKYIGF